MIKSINSYGQPLSISSVTPFPSIDDKKKSVKSQDASQHHSRYKYTYTRETNQSQIFNDRIMIKENPCIAQIQINNYKKKISYTAPKNDHLQQKQYETVQQACRLTQMRINKRVERNRSLFASAQKVSSKIYPSSQKSANHTLASRKKRNTAISKSKQYKIKPIISESNLTNYQPYFLNVEKMVLVDGGERNKKSQSVTINNNSIPQQKPPIRCNKFYPNSHLIKEINSIKEKFNIQRILQMNQQSLQAKAQNFHNFINIKSYESKKQLQKQQQIQSKQQSKSNRYRIQRHEQKMNNILKMMQISEQSKKKQNQSESTNTKAIVDTAKLKTTLKIEKDNKVTFNIIQNGIMTKNKNISAMKKYKKKFNVPFQTYYYRDLLWKINYTNSLYIQTPNEYEHRLKVFVGKGNNSCMVSGLISRRYWYAFTDRIQEANFVWTQLKLLQFYKKQTGCTDQPRKIQFSEEKMYQTQSLLTVVDSEDYKNYQKTYINFEQRSDERLIPRFKAFKYQKTIKSNEIRQLKMQNHLINNYVIGNKKALFNTMSNYYQQTNQQVFDFLPLTFHIKDGLEDKKYFQFLRYFHKKSKQVNRLNQQKKQNKRFNAWIVKPGENSNRGNGIKVCLNLQEIKSILKVREAYSDGSYRTYIVQQYIQKPLLYFKRKFDLRHYMMITCVNGFIKGYWYRDGYVRTTSSEYSLHVNYGEIHLTNDAVQKQLPEYGKYQKGNKLSYDELNVFIQKYHSKKNISFYEHIYPKMKKIATDTIRACSGGIDPSKFQNNFQVFGLDFMIDDELNVWLIEVNSNPCLELSCPLLASIIPRMVENTLELTLDAMFPPPVRYSPKGLHYLKQLQKQNRYELVYDERVQRLYSGSLQFLDNKLLEEEDDTFEDCGDDWEDS